MKIKISKILLVLSVCGLLYSCDKFFEVDLKAQMDEEKVVNNEYYLARLWAGLYWAMENGFTAVGNGGYASACDEADNNQQSSSVQKFNTGSWNAQSNPDDLYSQFYQAIRSANDFLRLSDTVNNPQYTFREYEKGEPEKYATKVFNWHAYRLDASFLKAYYHFELWKRYGDIAIADKLLTESEALALERTPGQEVVEYIVHALDSLAPMYDELETMKNTQYTNGKWIDNQYGRITKGAVLALKARVTYWAEPRAAVCRQPAELAFGTVRCRAVRSRCACSCRCDQSGALFDEYLLSRYAVRPFEQQSREHFGQPSQYRQLQ